MRVKIWTAAVLILGLASCGPAPTGNQPVSADETTPEEGTESSAPDTAVIDYAFELASAAQAGMTNLNEAVRLVVSSITENQRARSPAPRSS